MDTENYADIDARYVSPVKVVGQQPRQKQSPQIHIKATNLMAKESMKSEVSGSSRVTVAILCMTVVLLIVSIYTAYSISTSYYECQHKRSDMPTTEDFYFTTGSMPEENQTTSRVTEFDISTVTPTTEISKTTGAVTTVFPNVVKDLVNVLERDGVKCTASYEFSVAPCSKIYNGNMDPTHIGSWSNYDQNGWVNIDLPAEANVMFAITWSRCVLRDQFTSMEMTFNDGTKRQMHLTCDSGSSDDWRNCAGLEKPDVLYLGDINMTSVHLIFPGSCGPDGHPGFREILLLGRYI